MLTIQRAPDIFLLKCPSCAGASASRMPARETLDRYYGEYYRDRDGRAKVACDAPKRFAQHLASMISVRNRRTDLQILDFGGGDGTISVELAKILLGRGTRKIHIDLVDYAEATNADLPEAVTLHRQQALPGNPAPEYDFVLASAILEHLPDPRTDLIRLFSAIRPGGRLYVRTPWVAPILRWCERLGLPFDFTYPAHLHDFGRDFWERIQISLSFDKGRYRLVLSRPSFPETTFSQAPARTLVAHLIKAPGHFRIPWSYVGGWEALFERLA
ncbi:MAG: class I SAM-dependent methyltransferase [bacterium]